MARYGMLECGVNYKGTRNEQCDVCQVIDNEDHRLNSCTKWSKFNLCDTNEKMSFDHVFSKDCNTLRNAVKMISTV